MTTTLCLPLCSTLPSSRMIKVNPCFHNSKRRHVCPLARHQLLQLLPRTGVQPVCRRSLTYRAGAAAAPAAAAVAPSRCRPRQQRQQYLIVQLLLLLLLALLLPRLPPLRRCRLPSPSPPLRSHWSCSTRSCGCAGAMCGPTTPARSLMRARFWACRTPFCARTTRVSSATN